MDYSLIKGLTILPTILLRSGRYFNFTKPSSEDFTFYDIAGGLSKICRFGGQCQRFYSVAEHLHHAAYLSSHLEDLDVIRAIFMHDATESFIGDMVKPLKNLIPSFSEIESNIEKVIGKKFGIDFKTHHVAIKDIDITLLIAERNTLFSKTVIGWEWEDKARKISFTPFCWSPEIAECQFIMTAKRLGINTEI